MDGGFLFLGKKLWKLARGGVPKNRQVSCTAVFCSLQLQHPTTRPWAAKPVPATQGSHLIRFEHATFSYTGHRPALEDVCLHIPPGAFVAVVGANGSGKSTLARHINALALPQSGQVLVDGTSTANACAEAAALRALRSQVGLVFQNPEDQLVAQTVEDDVAFGPENLGLAPKQIRRRVDESLQAVGLGGFQARSTAGLSGGQKQLVALAGALALAPRVLVLDEATALLDPSARKRLMELVKGLHAQGLTVVMITQFAEEAAQAQLVAVLNQGRVEAYGAPKTVLADDALLRRCGLMPPFAARLSQLLRQRGVPVGPCFRSQPLKEQLCALLSNT